jgi:uroporphyrinogen-III synthase
VTVPAAPPDPLAQRRIAIAESRELDLFASLLERRGATVLRYPLVQVIDAPDPDPILAWLHRFASDGCDDLILLTGEGLRRLLQCIDRHEPALRGPFLAALARVRRITRGPKPARVLRELGLPSDLPAEVPTTAGLIALLRPLPLRERRVGVQLYGGEANRPLVDFLTEAGAQVWPVAPYRYADRASDVAVQELLGNMRRGAIDAIAFTSKAQVERLFRAAAAEDVRAALAATAVAAVGPVVAESLVAHGVDVGAMPPGSWHLKPLVAALGELLGAARG